MSAVVKSTGNQPYTLGEKRVIRMHGWDFNDILPQLVGIIDEDKSRYDWYLTYYQKRYIIVKNLKYDGDGIKTINLVLGRDKYNIFKEWMKEIGRW